MFANDTATPCEETPGGRIASANEASGLSTEDAARGLAVLGTCWNAGERDLGVPRANRLTMMATVLGVSLSWLLSGFGHAPLAQDLNDRDSV